MSQEPAAVAFQGNPLSLVGRQVGVGDPAPDFTVLANDLSAVRLCSLRGKVCVLISVPSLDTPVCDLEARRFNQEADKLGPDVAVLVISMDLPFAQARWCGAAGVKTVQTLSDHREAQFGTAYGLLIRELRLLARAVLVLDRQGTVRYSELVNEMTDQPDYDAAIQAVQSLL
jgi:thiol peroxidase